MISYIFRKLLLSIPLILGVITLIFILVQLSPGDATDRFFTPETPPEVRQMVMEKWGLDQPVHIQYLRMIGNLSTGDFGTSIAQERPVFDIIGEKLPNTLLLSGVTLSIIIFTGVSLGIAQAIRQYSIFDNLASVISLFFYSMPSFWLALMLILIFSLHLELLPASGMVDAVSHDFMSPSQKFWDRVRHLILPGVGLGVASSAGMARYMRSSMLEVIRQDYVRTARAKGLSETTVVLKHSVRNALLPIITLVGLSLPFLFSGSVLIEYVFAWPGMGRVIVEAIFTQDTPLIIACFFVFTILVVTGNLLADIAYSMVDPRIRLG
ncbi:MAG: peptide/nickel transport system permease protein [Myxococcota bacterium]|jgi:peptide/nickel transport system permease protein